MTYDDLLRDSPHFHPAAEPVKRLASGLREDVHPADRPRRDQVLWLVDAFMSDMARAGIKEFFLYHGNQAGETLEALREIGAVEAVQYLQNGCTLFPGRSPSLDQDERKKQMLAIAGGDICNFDQRIESGDVEYELYQMLLEYYRDGAPSIVVVDLSSVQTAAELLAAVAQGCGLARSFGNDVDAFCNAIIASNSVPRKLVLRGWDRVERILPRDTQMLLECWNDAEKEYPECACDLEFACGRHELEK